MAPQLIATNGRLRRGLASWIARAATSLPVPDSPRMRTLESWAAIGRINAPLSRIAGELPVGIRTLLPLSMHELSDGDKAATSALCLNGNDRRTAREAPAPAMNCSLTAAAP